MPLGPESCHGRRMPAARCWVVLPLLVLLLVSAVDPALGKKGGLETDKDNLTLDLKDAALVDVLETIRARHGISYEGDTRLLRQRTVSLRLNRVPLVQGLKRILGSLSYCFVYDAHQRVTGIHVLGSGRKAHTARAESRQNRARASGQARAPDDDRNKPHGPSRDAQLPPGFEVVENAAPPGAGAGRDAETPPGGSGASPPGPEEGEGPTPAESDVFRVRKNVGPPGGLPGDEPGAEELPLQGEETPPPGS